MVTQVFGGQLSEVPLWEKLPLVLFNDLIAKKKEEMRKQYGKSSGSSVKYQSQAEAEEAFQRENLPPEIYNQLE